MCHPVTSPCQGQAFGPGDVIPGLALDMPMPPFSATTQISLRCMDFFFLPLIKKGIDESQYLGET